MSDTINTTNTPAGTPAPAVNTDAKLTQSIADLWEKTVNKPKPEAAKPVETPKTEPASTEPKSLVFDRRPKVKSEPATEQAKPATIEQAPVTQAPAVDPLESLEPEKNLSEAAKNNFAKLREGYKTYKQRETEWTKREAEYKAKLEAQQKTQASPAVNEETERLKAEYKAMADRMAILDIQNHPDFVKQYVQPKQAAITAAQEILEYNEKKADLNALLDKPLKEFNAELSNLTKGMNLADQSTVLSELRSAYKVNNDSKSAMAKSQDIAKELGQKSMYDQKSSFEAAWSDIAPNYALLKAEIPSTADSATVSALKAYNDGVDGVRSSAERYAFGNLHPKETATVATKAALLDFMVNHGIPKIEAANHAAQQRIASLESELQQLKAARNPGVPAGDRPPTSQPQYKSANNLEDFIAKNWPGGSR